MTQAEADSFNRPFIPLLEGTEVVAADNVSEYLYATSKQEDWEPQRDFPMLMLPFDLMWIECKRPSKIHSEKYGELPGTVLPFSWGAAFAVVTPNSPLRGIAQAVPNAQLERAFQHVVAVSYVEQAKDTYVGPCGVWEYVTDNEGYPFDGVRYGVMSGEVHHTPHMKAMIDAFNSSIYPMMLAITFMHVKNVTRIRVTPDEKLNRAHLKRRGRNLVRYSVLRIDPFSPKSVKVGTAESKGDPLPRALHIVRGVLADYTERGLFGRENLRGKYWKPAHMRGVSQAGMVVKDYEIDTEKPNGTKRA